MVGRWGMSEAIGPLAVLPSEYSGPFPPTGAAVSAATLERVDEEVRRIVERAYNEVVKLLNEQRHRLDTLAEALLEHETLDEDDAYAAAGVAHPAAAAASAATAVVANGDGAP
jgi:cell division protease FtsH